MPTAYTGWQQVMSISRILCPPHLCASHQPWRTEPRLTATQPRPPPRRQPLLQLLPLPSVTNNVCQHRPQHLSSIRPERHRQLPSAAAVAMNATTTITMRSPPPALRLPLPPLPPRLRPVAPRRRPATRPPSTASTTLRRPTVPPVERRAPVERLRGHRPGRDRTPKSPT